MRVEKCRQKKKKKKNNMNVDIYGKFFLNIQFEFTPLYWSIL